MHVSTIHCYPQGDSGTKEYKINTSNLHVQRSKEVITIIYIHNTFLHEIHQHTTLVFDPLDQKLQYYMFLDL
jgi:hypothetical protein